jgi:hypothetical protein
VAHLVVEVAEIQSQADAARHAILDTATDSGAASPLMHVRNASPVVEAVIPAAAITEILFGVLSPDCRPERAARGAGANSVQLAWRQPLAHHFGVKMTCDF